MIYWYQSYEYPFPTDNLLTYIFIFVYMKYIYIDINIGNFFPILFLRNKSLRNDGIYGNKKSKLSNILLALNHQ